MLIHSFLKYCAKVYFEMVPFHPFKGIQQILESYHKLQFQQDPDEMDTFSMTLLAMHYYKQKKYDQAEAILLQVISIGESVLTEGHPDMFAALNQLAVLYYEKGDHQKAERLFLRVAAVKRLNQDGLEIDIVERPYSLAELAFEMAHT